MGITALKINEIQKELFLLPDEKIDEVKDFVDFILHKSKAKKRKVVKMEGIWEGKGFEKIKNLEEELKAARKEISESVLKKGA